jgi:hypothetical protein
MHARAQHVEVEAKAGQRLLRLAFGVNLLAAAAQVALVRELSAYHGLSAMDMFMRLVVVRFQQPMRFVARADLRAFHQAVLMAATPLGALLAPTIARVGERWALAVLGASSALYWLASLFGLLWWLEPWLAGPSGWQVIRSSVVLRLGVLLSPPFIVCGMVSAHAAAAAAASMTRPRTICLGAARQPLMLELVLGVALLGSAAGSALAHYWGQWVGVNTLIALTALCLVRTPRACMCASGSSNPY